MESHDQALNHSNGQYAMDTSDTFLAPSSPQLHSDVVHPLERTSPQRSDRHPSSEQTDDSDVDMDMDMDSEGGLDSDTSSPRLAMANQVKEEQTDKDRRHRKRRLSFLKRLHSFEPIIKKLLSQGTSSSKVQRILRREHAFRATQKSIELLQAKWNIPFHVPRRAGPFAVDEVRSDRRPSVYDACAGRLGVMGFLHGRHRIHLKRGRLYSHVPWAADSILGRRRHAPKNDYSSDYAARDLLYFQDRHLDAVANPLQRLPDPDLLKALHAHAAEFYGAGGHLPGGVLSKTPDDEELIREVDYFSMDGTALMALGILIEESCASILGPDSRGANVLTQPPLRHDDQESLWWGLQHRNVTAWSHHRESQAETLERLAAEIEALEQQEGTETEAARRELREQMRELEMEHRFKSSYVGQQELERRLMSHEGNEAAKESKKKAQKAAEGEEAKTVRARARAIVEDADGDYEGLERQIPGISVFEVGVEEATAPVDVPGPRKVHKNKTERKLGDAKVPGGGFLQFTSRIAADTITFPESCTVADGHDCPCESLQK
ncbi:hypothetical protein K402DRAFT_420130 [Aulographum hederae CBS 113979]|uniref:Uncharacterized protein n=1 Tax=Aulographum hederae CBS 113979 TaxID=1176131 RepID=A0A6G1H3J0_9PEZI|nr:hypothetical protein K402DRAFT_420130 [Aulographum hederae CBS 113979]